MQDTKIELISVSCTSDVFMNYKKWLYTGIAIFVGSLLLGTLGTVWRMYSSFAALETAENAGIGPVGAGIENALIFTAGGLVGSALGTVLIVIGGVKAYRSSKSKTNSPMG